MRYLFFFLAFGVAAFAQQLSRPSSDTVFAKNYGTPSYSTLTNVIRLIGASKKTLVLDGGEWAVLNDVALHTNTTLEIRPDSVMNVASGKSVYVSRLVDGMHQMFTGTLAGEVQSGAFTMGTRPLRYELDILGLTEARPEWFGARANDARGDAIAINTAQRAGNAVRFSSGTYYIDSMVRTLSGKSFIGAGRDATILKTYPSLSYFHVSGFNTQSVIPIVCYSTSLDSYVPGGRYTSFVDEFMISDMTLDANYDGFAAAGLRLAANNFHIDGQGVTITRCKIKGFGAGPSGSPELMAAWLGAGTVDSDKPNIVEDCLFTEPGNSAGYGSNGQINHGSSCSYLTNVAAFGTTVNDDSGQFLWSYNVVPTKATKIIRNCVFDGIDLTFGSGAVISTLGALSSANVVENNIIRNSYGVYPYINDTQPIDPLIIRGNQFVDTYPMLFIHELYGGTYRNVLIEDNYFKLRKFSSGDQNVHFEFVIGVPTNVITGHASIYSTSSVVAARFLPCISNFVIRGNVFEQGSLVGAEREMVRIYEDTLRIAPAGSYYLGYLTNHVLIKDLSIVDNTFIQVGGDQTALRFETTLPLTCYRGMRVARNYSTIYDRFLLVDDLVNSSDVLPVQADEYTCALTDTFTNAICFEVRSLYPGLENAGNSASWEFEVSGRQDDVTPYSLKASLDISASFWSGTFDAGSRAVTFRELTYPSGAAVNWMYAIVTNTLDFTRVLVAPVATSTGTPLPVKWDSMLRVKCTKHGNNMIPVSYPIGSVTDVVTWVQYRSGDAAGAMDELKFSRRVTEDTVPGVYFSIIPKSGGMSGGVAGNWEVYASGRDDWGGYTLLGNVSVSAGYLDTGLFAGPRNVEFVPRVTTGTASNWLISVVTNWSDKTQFYLSFSSTNGLWSPATNRWNSVCKVSKLYEDTAAYDFVVVYSNPPSGLTWTNTPKASYAFRTDVVSNSVDITTTTPVFFGQEYYNGASGKWYKAIGLTTNSWKEL